MERDQASKFINDLLKLMTSRNGSDLFLTFAPRTEPAVLDPVAVVSQSGGFGDYIQKLAAMRGLAFAFNVATGNECDLECSEFISLLAQRDDVKVILLYMEGIRSTEKFVDSLDLARRAGKAVIALKSGASERGARERFRAGVYVRSASRGRPDFPCLYHTADVGCSVPRMAAHVCGYRPCANCPFRE